MWNIKKVLLAFMLLFSSLCFGQDDTTAIVEQTYSTDYEYYKNWQFVNLADTISAEVLAFFPAPFDCVGWCLTTASMTIVVTKDNDTIRVLSNCDDRLQIEPGSKITIVPAGNRIRGTFYPTLNNQKDEIQRTSLIQYRKADILTTMGFIYED